MKRILVGISFGAMVLAGCGNSNNQEKKTEDMITEKDGEIPKRCVFPVGEPNTAYAQYFSGRSWLAPLTKMSELNVPVSNVTFEPGCRNNWHSHTGGQILIAVGGMGYYQERGKKAVRMVPGDVIEIAPNVEHWHGAAPDQWFSHLAIACNPLTNENYWLNPVSEEEYAQAVRQEESQ